MSAALVSLPPYMFAQPTRLYYLQREMYKYGVVIDWHDVRTL